MLRVIRKKAFCRALGPGCRSVIWFYGCSRSCLGCIADSMNKSNKYESYEPYQLAEWVINNQGIEGITLSGGEPFEQPKKSLEQFLKSIRKNSNLSILCYTGNRYEKLIDDIENQKILKYIDVLIDGEYQINNDNGQRWRGSENQRFHFLTSRYAAEKDKWLIARERQIEIELDLNGSILLSGIPSKDFIENLTTQLDAKNISIDFS
ncbi:MAG: radical SAM protein [Planctomycetaceae bacterium]|jgi:anaerobic ribonucleoside-triphosphate reductase activating protein|nr:radical SAM protein [Planctomycetaceae bacterium]